MEGTYEAVRVHSDCSDPPPSNDLCRQERVLDDVSIVLVGKYTDMTDSYMSVVKSLEHSAFRCNRKLVLQARTFLNLGFDTSLTYSTVG